MRVAFPAIRGSVFRLYGCHMVGKLYHWHLRYFHIKTVGCGEAPAFPHQKPGSVQLVQCAFYGGAAFIQRFRYLRNGIDNLCPALAVLPAVLLSSLAVCDKSIFSRK